MVFVQSSTETHYENVFGNRKYFTIHIAYMDFDVVNEDFNVMDSE